MEYIIESMTFYVEDRQICCLFLAMMILIILVSLLVLGMIDLDTPIIRIQM